MYGFGDDIVIDGSCAEILTTRISLVMTAEAASQLELAAFREGMTTGELVQHMLRDYLNHAGIWS